MKKIGIIGAMELEVEALKAKMTIENTVQKASNCTQRNWKSQCCALHSNTL